MKFVKVLAGAAATLASSAAMAGTLTGNVGVVSDYMFRGVDQNGGAAVQGGVDYGFDFGLYTGLWVTNAGTSGSGGNGNEADVYVGYGLKLGEFALDTGVIYYAYTEDTEAAGASNGDYAEVYVGGGLGPISLKVFYVPEFGGDTPAGSALATGSGDLEKNELMYVTASANLTLTDTVSFTPQVGFTSGDGIKDSAVGDEYTDYSITATKKLKDDMSVSLAVVATDLEFPPAGSDQKDNPKFVIGFKRNFKI